jgi:glycosyltransferase involved in cell wall biosynthesis
VAAPIVTGTAGAVAAAQRQDPEVVAGRSRTVSFVTWYPSCRRSDALAGWFGGNSHLIHFLEFKQPLYAPAKYVLQAVATWRRLRQDRPTIVFVASPPVFAGLVVWLYARCFGARYVVDAHTGVFTDPRWRWMGLVSRWLSRSAIATVVTSEALASRVREWGARAVVIGDVPVTFADTPRADLGPGFHAVVINTFSEDEPIAQVMEAARMTPECSFHVTGNPRHGRNRWRGELPANVRFTGWLSDEAYAGLLRGASVVMCLTTRDLTMQRGGYEAMALEKPLITSDWPLLRDTFRRGTIHVDNTAAGIARGIGSARARLPELAGEMRTLRHERAAVYQTAIEALDRIIDQERTRR